MPSDQLREKDIFNVARTITAPEARNAYLRQVCGDDAALMDRVAALLLGLAKQESFLESPAALPDTAAVPMTESVGTIVGPYKLLQQIGEGGFGVVYMAAQTEPVRRKVALKVIKPGMDTKEVIARFEAERQALALMDHPNIARVLDAGATESGRPYFVMELVKGVPLTEYCDKNHLPTHQRLTLFVDVCHAIQHAHQKGVIHRDLKPSNIMVTLHDGKPVAKVIDFGVSKALSQQLTEKTLFTAYGQMVGTPAYMSPEQAEMSGLDIDTRSDVYSLGVLLYELLTGSTPFDAKLLREAGYAEMQRIICEEEPIKPSTRLTTLGEESTVVSRNRGTDPKKLGQLIRGELDWIVMKALEKDRNRRYETANGLAADIERFLSDEPVTACPPSTAYRFRKFASRNRGPMAAVAMTSLALVLIAIGSLLAAGRFRNLAQRNADLVAEKDAALTTAIDAEAAARQAQEDAETARDQERARRQEAQQQRQRAQANLALARSAVDEFLNQVTDNELLSVPGLQPLRRDLLISALEFYQGFAEEKGDDPALQAELAAANYRIGRIQRELGQKEAGDKSIAFAVERFRSLLQQGSGDLEVRIGLTRAVYHLGRYDDALELCHAIRETDAKNPEIMSLLSDTYNTLAIQDKTDRKAAIQYHRDALSLHQQLVDRFPDNAAYLAAMGATLNNIGVLLSQRRESQDLYRLGAMYKARAYELAPHSILWGGWLAIGLRNEALLNQQRGLHEQALESYQRVVDVNRKLVFDNPAVESLKGKLAKAWLELGNYQRSLDKLADANHSLRRVVEILEQIPRETPTQLFALAEAYSNLAVPPDDDATADPQEESEEDRSGSDFDEFAAAQRSRYARLAIETLREAIEQGFADFDALDGSQPFQALAGLEEYRTSLQQLRESLRAATAVSKEPKDGAEHLASRQSHLPLFRDLIASDPPEVQREITLASAAHAFGLLLIQADDLPEAEESIQEAKRIRSNLLENDPDNPRFQADLGGTLVARAQILWKTAQFPEAIQEFDAGLELLQTARETAPDDVLIQQQVADWQRRAYIRYAELGLWDKAAEFARLNLALRRVTDLTWDTRFTLLLGLTGDPEGQRQYGQLIAERESPGAPLTLMANCTVPDPLMPVAELIDWADAVDDTKSGWRASMAAIAHYRAGQYDEALELLEATQSHTKNRYREYWLAMIHTRLGHEQRATQLFEEAEANYADLARLCVTESSIAQEFGDLWERLAHTQLIRNEAWETLRSREPPPDPWQHLMEARGYWLIGNTERAEIELQEAIAAAPKDPNVRTARAELFARLGSDERAAGEWQKALELAGDDPNHWMQRGLWHARRGEEALATADFRKVVELAAAAELWKVRADALGRLGKWAEAIEDLSRAISNRPDDKELLASRAELYSKANQPRKAVDDFSRASGSLPLHIVESGWQLTRSLIVPGARSARFGPDQTRLYFGTRDTDSDGLYSIDQQHTIRKIAEGDRVTGVAIDPEDGTIFFSQPYDGLIYRVAEGNSPRELWISQFKSTDSDPRGMAVIPNSYAGDEFNPGDVLVVDHGYGGPDEIYRFSVREPENAILLYSDKEGEGLLENPVDVAVGPQDVYLVDTTSGGRIYTLAGDGTLTRVPPQETLEAPNAICVDPTTGKLLVLDHGGDRLLRVDPSTGAVDLVAVDLDIEPVVDDTSSLDVTPDGQRIVISVADLILELTSTGEHRGLPPEKRGQHLIDHYTKLIQQDPKNWMACRARGQLYKESGRLDEAIADFTVCIEANPRDANLLTVRAWCYRRVGNPDAAVMDLNRAIELKPNSATAYRRRAAIRIHVLKQFGKGIADCEQLLRLAPRDVTALLHRATARRFLAQYGTAMEDAVRAVKIEPSNQWAWDELTRIARASRSPQQPEALDRLREHFEGQPNNAESLAQILLVRADLNVDAGDTAQALANCDTARRLAPDSCGVLRRCGELNKEAGDLDQAIADYTAALEIDPQNALVLHERSIAHCRKKDFESALQDSNRAIELGPQSYMYSERALPLIVLGRDQDAIADCDRALELDPANATALHRRAWALERLGHLKAAVTDAVAAVMLEPSSHWTWNRLRSCVHKSQNPEQLAALDELEHHLKTNGEALSSHADSLADFYLIRALAYATHAMDERAFPDCELASRLLGDSPTPFEKISAVYFSDARWEEVLQACRRALELGSEDPVTIQRIATALVETGQEDPYRDHCRAMLERFADTEEPHVAGAVVQCFTYLPWSESDLQEPLRLARLAADHPEIPAWGQHRYGLLLYRLGRFEEAREQLAEVLERPADQPHGNVLFALAMTQHALGNVQRADELLKRGQQWLAERADKAIPVARQLGREAEQRMTETGKDVKNKQEGHETN